MNKHDRENMKESWAKFTKRLDHGEFDKIIFTTASFVLLVAMAIAVKMMVQSWS